LLFSIFGFRHLKMVWKIHRNLKMGRARLSTAQCTHLCVLGPRDPGHRCLPHSPITTYSASCRPISFEGAHPLSRLFNPWREEIPRSPFRSIPKCHATLLCSSSLPTPLGATKSATGKPHTRVKRHSREHPTHPLPSFDQGLAMRTTPPLGSQAVSAVVTFSLVTSSASCCFLPCARATAHSPVAYCLGFELRKPSTPIRLESMPLSLCRPRLGAPPRMPFSYFHRLKLCLAPLNLFHLCRTLTESVSAVATIFVARNAAVTS
jgi:hypothetical protein